MNKNPSITTTLLTTLGTIVMAIIVAKIAGDQKEKKPLVPNELTNLPKDWNKYH